MPPEVLDDIFERAGLERETRCTRWEVSVATTSRAGDGAPEFEPKVKLCAACGSDDTRCTYARGQFSKEVHMSFELRCEACGAYSWWSWDAW